jgi:hypothetical protein
MLKDNNGSPHFQTAGGPAVTRNYVDFNKHYFRTIAGTQMFAIGDALVSATDDADAASKGVPLYGYYRSSAGVVIQRVS